MSRSIRMERVHKVKSPDKKLWKFKIALTDTTFITRVLKELNFANIRYEVAMSDRGNETVYDFVSSRKDGKTIGLKRDGTRTWEFAGYGKEKEIQRLSRRFADLLGAYHTMALLDAQGLNYQLSKNENVITIQIS